jgi:methylmalonyl-CoA/ethylmalonyl-CoA epimerase
VLNHAQVNGSKLRKCEACNVFGSHPHPEGFVAFLDNETSGTEIEFMQVYNSEELKKYQIDGV